VLVITGNTYPHRDEIRAAGGKWDAARKCWRIKYHGTQAVRGRLSSLTVQLRDDCDFEYLFSLIWEAGHLGEVVDLTAKPRKASPKVAFSITSYCAYLRAYLIAHGG
jgi:hypothetical protein